MGINPTFIFIVKINNCKMIVIAISKSCCFRLLGSQITAASWSLTTFWTWRNPRNISSFSINKFYLYNSNVRINVDTIASRKRTACNSYLYGWALLRLRSSPRLRQGIVNGIIKNNVHTTYIHGLCRSNNICLRHTVTVYKDCRKCRVPRRPAFSPFFFLLPTIAQKWEGNGKG